MPGEQDCRTCKHNLYAEIKDREFFDCLHPIALARGPKWERGDPSIVDMRTADFRMSEIDRIGDCPTWEARHDR